MPVDVGALGADFYAWTGTSARADGHRRAARPPRAPRGDAAVPHRRGHDRLGRTSSRRRGTSCRTSSRRARRRSPRRSGWARQWTICQKLGMDRVRAHERALTAYMLDGLARCPGFEWSDRRDAEARGGLASFTIEGIHPHDVAELAGREGVCIRASHHCAQPLMRCLGVRRPRARASASTTTRGDVDALIDALRPGARCSGCRTRGNYDGRPLPRLHPRPLQAARETSASSSRTTWRRSSTTPCAATSSGCTSA